MCKQLSHLRLIDYGLRRYEGEQDVDWPAVDYAPMAGLPMLHIAGCDPGCVHEWQDGPVTAVGRNDGGRDIGGRGGNYQGDGPHKAAVTGAYCAKCGGWRGGLGNEPTLEAYIGHLVLCLREWRRVLRTDGCVFCNLGDSYAGSGKGNNPNGKQGTNGWTRFDPDIPGNTPTGLKPKDLMLVPARFALAAQADGWWLRSDIIGAKVAPMPESVTDRPTRSHEHIFMLTKAARYFWDSEAVKEASVDPEGSARRYEIPFHVGAKEVSGNGRPGNAANTPGMKVFTGTRNMRDVIEWRPSPFNAASRTVHWERVASYDGGDDTYCKVSLNCPVHGDWLAQVARGQGDGRADGDSSRNQRTGDYLFEGQEGDYVPIDRLHAAGFQVESLGYSRPGYSPSAIDHSKQSRRTGHAPATNQPCIASAQTVARTGDTSKQHGSFLPQERTDDSSTSAASAAHGREIDASQTSCHNGHKHTVSAELSYTPPKCTCQLYRKIAKDATNHFAVWPEAIPEKLIRAATRPDDLVLDPFSGSGTTAKVAVRLGRRVIGVDVCAAYLDDITAQRFGAGVQMELAVTP